MVDNNQLTETAGSSLRGFGWYGLIFILIAVLLFNSDEFGISSNSIIAYGLLLIGFKSWYDISEPDIISFGGVFQPFRNWFEKKKIKDGSLIKGALFYFGFFFLVWFILKTINDFYNIGVSSILPQQLESTVIFQTCIVTPIETLVFHVMIPLIMIWEFESYNKISWKVYVPVTFIISQILFSLFHYSVYQGNISSLLQAFFIGLGFMGIVYTFGISAGISTHLSLNLFILGITSRGIVGIETLTFMNGTMATLIIVSFSIFLMIKLFNRMKSLRGYKEKQKVFKYGYWNNNNRRKVNC